MGSITPRQHSDAPQDTVKWPLRPPAERFEASLARYQRFVERYERFARHFWRQPRLRVLRWRTAAHWG